MKEDIRIEGVHFGKRLKRTRTHARRSERRSFWYKYSEIVIFEVVVFFIAGLFVTLLAFFAIKPVTIAEYIFVPTGFIVASNMFLIVCSD
jgi:hypothetical protein